MFRAVITRDHGEPWGPTGMTSAKWLNQPAREFRICELIATQPGVLLRSLMDTAPAPVGGDPLAHVIEYRGALYLEDGHHRTVRAALAGKTTVTARWLRIGYPA